MSTNKTEWQKTVAGVFAAHPGISLKDALKKAKKKYRKKQKGGALPTKPIGIMPIMTIPKISPYKKF